MRVSGASGSRRSRQPPRAHPAQRARAARGRARMARAPAVAQQVHVQLELGAARRQSAASRRAARRTRRRGAAGRAACRRARRACRRARRGARRRTAARTPRSCGRRRAARSGTRAPARTGASRIHERSRSSGSASRISLMRRDFCTCRPPGWIAASISSTGASRTAAQLGEALAQAQVGDVAVAVVRGLREDGQDELGERVAVRLHRRHPVERAQTLAQRAHARGRRGAASSCVARDGRRSSADTGADGIVRPPMQAITEHTEEIDGQPVFWRSARRRRVARPVPPRRAHEQRGLEAVPARSRRPRAPTSRASGAAASAPTASTRWRATTTSSSASSSTLGARARAARRARLGRRRAALGAAPPRARRAPRRRSTPCRCCPATAGTASRASGARAAPASSRWARIVAATLKQSHARGPRDARRRCRTTGSTTTIAHFDQGTQRAILRLYRSSPPAQVSPPPARGSGESRCPALVVWGERDPYIPPRFAAALRRRRSAARRACATCPDAGHWPWLDRPDLVERIGTFLDGGRHAASA